MLTEEGIAPIPLSPSPLDCFSPSHNWLFVCFAGDNARYSLLLGRSAMRVINAFFHLFFAILRSCPAPLSLSLSRSLLHFPFALFICHAPQQVPGALLIRISCVPNSHTHTHTPGTHLSAHTHTHLPYKHLQHNFCPSTWVERWRKCTRLTINDKRQAVAGGSSRTIPQALETCQCAQLLFAIESSAINGKAMILSVVISDNRKRERERGRELKDLVVELADY